VSNKPEHRDIKWKFHLEIFGPRLERLLVDLLLDPFDEVRSTALHLLKLFPKDVLFGGVRQTAEKPELLIALDKAGQLASNTSRADHADTVARLYSVIFFTADSREPGEINWWDTRMGVVGTILQKLEDKLSSPEGLFNSALRDAPLHGYLCALRYKPVVYVAKYYTNQTAGILSLHQTSTRLLLAKAPLALRTGDQSTIKSRSFVIGSGTK
jgi:hypothetical protein